MRFGPLHVSRPKGGGRARSAPFLASTSLADARRALGLPNLLHQPRAPTAAIITFNWSACIFAVDIGRLAKPAAVAAASSILAFKAARDARRCYRVLCAVTAGIVFAWHACLLMWA